VTLRIGTRGSPLALAQAGAVAGALRAQGMEIEVVPIRTEGDRLGEVRLGEVGGKGLFVRELEEALLAGRVDLAVHSLKDLPAEVPEELVLAAFPRREDARDVLVSRVAGTIAALPAGATVGTSSLRRRALLLAARPDLTVVPLRGNVDTRLRKLDEGQACAIVVAAAGLARLGLALPHGRALPAEEFVPAVGQGILGVEARRGDQRALSIVAGIDDTETRRCALAERAYLQRLGGSCNTPLAGHAELADGRLRMTAVVLSEDGRRVVRDRVVAAADDPVGVGRRLAEALLARGAAAIAALDPVQ
jgi:hydroxymethylbilane synthase